MLEGVPDPYLLKRVPHELGYFLTGDTGDNQGFFCSTLKEPKTQTLNRYLWNTLQFLRASTFLVAIWVSLGVYCTYLLIQAHSM